MPTLRRTLQRQFDSGLATTLLIASMAVALWFASQHWHERAFTTLGMAALAVLSIADLRRRRRQAEDERRTRAVLTEAKLAAEEAAEEARHAREAKGRFLAMMSHEIRTPMNGVLGMIDLLADTQLDADQRRLLGRSRESSVALLAIINDILDFSKIEAGKLELERKPLSLRALAEDVCASLSTEAARRRVAVAVHVEGEVPRRIVGDPVRLRQILVNLVGNAVKFTADGRVDVHAGVDGGALVMQVRDTGVGIPAETLGHLFQPFEQADAATTRRYGGTGLGLSIVKRLAELMGGTVVVTSTPGVGSCFAVRLPLVAAADDGRDDPSPTRDAPALARRAAPCGLRALLAEDHPINREVIGMQLAKLGWDCDWAEDGEAAWDLLQDDAARARYAALLTDCHMPRLDGLGLVQRLRDDERAHGRAHMPVIALTANALQGEGERCLAGGMDAYLTKPLLVEDLAAALASLVPAPRYAFLRDACGGDLARMDALLRVMSTQAAADLDALHTAIDRGDAAMVVVLSRRLQAIADQLESPQAAAPLAALASETQGTAWHALLEDARTALRTAMARACNFTLSAT